MKNLFAVLVIFLGYLLPNFMAESQTYSWTERTSAGARAWWSIASSSDGLKLVATTQWSYVYTSTDGGSSWVQRSLAGSYQGWPSIASSSDGLKLAYVDYNNYAFTSTDGGAIWTTQTSAGHRPWLCITSSSDGEKLAAGTVGGYIYTSNDAGVTWTERTGGGTGRWSGITSSSDGMKLAATKNGGCVYLSTDGGLSWIEKTSSGARNWYSVASSATGTKLAAAVYGGYIYTSIDGGETWIAKTSAGAGNWFNVTSSSDGTTLAAADDGGYIVISRDGGETWTDQTAAGFRNWYGIACSSDGTKLIAGDDNGGYLYSGTLQSGQLLLVKDEMDRPVQGATFQVACGGTWVGTIGPTDANGYMLADIPECMTKIKAKVMNSSKELSKAELQASNYTWTTQVLRVYLKDYSGTPFSNSAGSLSQGGGSWCYLGNFNNLGYIDVQTFPTASAKYRATLNCTNETHDGIVIGEDPGIQTYDFQTGKVTGSCITLYTGCGWTTFVNGLELLPGTYIFKSPIQSGTVSSGQITMLNCAASKMNANTSIPSEVALLQNYPNPFNPSTKIVFGLPEETMVVVIIYDIHGRPIKTLLNEQRLAGWHFLDFKANGVATGNYIYRIYALGQVLSRSMTLVE